ncbi:MAG: PAS domain S-box protein, partial [Spirochaetia bacterium]|nr:PAS domain S-box protein [Spirochaetia bacterium]
GGSWGATMSQIERGIVLHSPRNTEEITVGITEGDKFRVLRYNPKIQGLETVARIDFGSHLAEPLQNALKGKKGGGILHDYENKVVLAGYASVPLLRAGIVYKISLKEMQNAYIETALWIGLIFLLIIPVLTVVIYYLTRPLKEYAEKNEFRFSKKLSQKESELIDSRSRLKLTQRIAKIGSWEYNILENTLYWSDEIYEMFGIDKEKTILSYDAFLQCVHPEDREEVDAIYAKSLRDKTDYRMIHRIVLPDGSIKWIQEIGETHYNEKNSAVVTLGSVQDITDRILLHESMISTNQILEAVLDTTPVMIAYLDTEMNFVRVNRTYAEADHKKPEDLAGKNHFELFPNEENEKIFRNVVNTGVPYIAKAKAFEYEHNPERGLTHWDWTLTPIKDMENRVTGLVLSLMNVTDRIEALESLQMSEQKLKDLNESLEKRVEDRTLSLEDALSLNNNILETSSVGISAYKETGECVFANESICSLIGATHDQVVSQNFNTIPSWQKYGLLNVAHEVLKTGVVSAGEYHIVTSFGKDAWFEIVFSRFKRNGQLHLLIQLTDRTLWKEAEDLLVKAKDEAERASRAKSDFLSRMSHELRTPLNAIIGFSQVMTHENLTDEQKDYIQEIRLAGDHLLNLINELLDLSRIELGKFKTDLSGVQVSSVMEQALKIVKPLADQKQISIFNKLNSDKTMVFSDKIRLKQIFINLLGNAVKYNRHNGSIKIENQFITEDVMRISITDTGPGIEAEKIPVLFQPFERLGAEFSDIQGTGIGLALSKKMAELMGAELGVESTPGKGSIFWIDLLLIPEIPKDLRIDEAIDEEVHDDTRMRVLYIEDNAANLKVVESLLKYHNQVTLLSATTGEYGFELASRYTPDIILLDIHLPDIDGYQVLKMLQTDPATSSIPVIALSADAMPIDIERGMKSGFAQYLTKPVMEQDLIQALENAVRIMTGKP